MRTADLVALVGALTLSAATAFGQAPNAREAGFKAFLAEVEATQVQLVNGHAEAFKALWSHQDDVTLSGGLGGAIAKGWKEVGERLDWVATQYTKGSRTHQVISSNVGENLAYVVMKETIRFTSPSDGKPVVQELRVTQIFRREDGRWRIVHRHADAQIVRQITGF